MVEWPEKWLIQNTARRTTREKKNATKQNCERVQVDHVQRQFVANRHQLVFYLHVMHTSMGQRKK